MCQSDDGAVNGLNPSHACPEERCAQPIKCVVWDLDDTLWHGSLAEGDKGEIREGVADIIRELDRRGILQSICSKNSFNDAQEHLERKNLRDYFLYPQIGWDRKSTGVAKISELLNLHLDTFAFVDDQQFERDEVQFSHPEVLCFNSIDLSKLLSHPRVTVNCVTDEARGRRFMYQAELQRRVDEEQFSGPQEDFLASLRMVLQIRPAVESDLRRAAELTARTHQLNTTGCIYSADELLRFSSDPSHMVYAARLDDRYGTYGIIGFALTEVRLEYLSIKLLLMSCRVASRGVGTVFLIYLMNIAKRLGLGLQAEFVPGKANRIMDVTFRLAGFQENDRRGELVVLRREDSEIPGYPDYVEVRD